jgi:hypothetical protein
MGDGELGPAAVEAGGDVRRRGHGRVAEGADLVAIEADVGGDEDDFIGGTLGADQDGIPLGRTKELCSPRQRTDLKKNGVQCKEQFEVPGRV